MLQHTSSLHRLKESPDMVLLPSKGGAAIYIAALAAISVLCIISFSFTAFLI